VAAHWIAERQSGPLILRFGTETQKSFFIPRICRAEAFFCIGMSEPDIGSDLASVRSRATRVEGGWKLNGTKLWSTHAHQSHYMIALFRTSGTIDDRHRGLSQFMIDLAAPGVIVSPIRDLTGDEHFAEVTFDSVIVADDALIGTEGAGWTQVNSELAYERSGPERFLSNQALANEWRTWLGAADECRSEDVATVGRLLARLAVLRSLSVSLTDKLLAGVDLVTEAALMKDIGTGFEQEIPELVGNSLAADPRAHISASLVATLAFATMIAPSYSLRGGTREILRGIIARGIGLR